MATEGKVTLVGSKGNQEIEKFEGGVKDTLLTEESLAPGLTLSSAQNQTATETFTPIEGKKRHENDPHARPCRAQHGEQPVDARTGPLPEDERR